MKDLTMIIPHLEGNEYRARNLRITLDYYTDWFPEMKKIVIEVTPSGQKVSPTSDFDVYYFEKPEPYSHSYVINRGVEQVKTKFVLVGDNDVLADARSIETLYNKMTSGEVDYGHPFTECIDLPQTWDGTLDGIQDCFANPASLGSRKSFGRPPVGGIYMVDREKYLEWGGSDEDFTTYGGEDDCRHVCFLNQGAKYWRDTTSIIHLWHPRVVQTRENIELLRQKCDWISNPEKYQS